MQNCFVNMYILSQLIVLVIVLVPGIEATRYVRGPKVLLT